MVPVRGTVVDHDSDVPLPGAEVSITPSESEDRRRPAPHPATVTAGADGRFEVCGPRGRRIDLTARFRGRTASVELESGGGEAVDAGRLRIDLGPPGVLSGTMSPPPGAGVSVRVRLAELGIGAPVHEDGTFEFPPVPAGRYALELHTPDGRRPADTVRVLLGHAVTLELSVATRPELPPLHVTVQGVRSLRLESVGFYARRNSGAGDFFTAEEIRERGVRRMSDLFRRIAGVEVRGGYVELQRAPVSLRTGTRCSVQYFVNGQAIPIPVAIDEYAPEDIAGLEVYRGPATLPGRFNRRRSACGAVVLWLHRGR